ncbi:MAG: glycosyltransferase family 4 protein [Myxococcales bacterium]|nr:glycosyltransferase family 4 protein [Myxococcales bacterium]
MHVVVNATSARLGGGITVLRNLLPAMLEVDEGRHRYTVLASSEIAEALDSPEDRLRFVPLPLERFGLPARLAWEQLAGPLLSLREKADVLLSPANLALGLSPVPQVLVIQNVAPFDAEVVARANRMQKARFEALRLLGIASARRCQRVVFLSDYSQRAVAPQLGVPDSRCRRIYLGRDERFAPEASAQPGPERARRPYLLSVSQFYHYKNFVELVEGFALAAEDLPQELSLVLAGAEHEPDYVARVRAAVARHGLGERVVFAGHVPYEELPALYAGAEVFLFPSTCENFPNILVEGLASGTPTLAAALGPMPEIAGEGARYFNPHSPRSIADAILELWRDPEARAALSRRGVEQARRYHWERCARELLAVLVEARDAG